MANVRVTVDNRAIERLLSSPSGDVGRAMGRAGLAIVSKARQNLDGQDRAIDTGRLRQSIRHRVARTGKGIEVTVTAHAEHAVFVHQGTGIRGAQTQTQLTSRGPKPSGQMIVPRRAKVLRWPAPGGGGFIYRPRSRGQSAKPFLARALEQLKISDLV